MSWAEEATDEQYKRSNSLRVTNKWAKTHGEKADTMIIERPKNQPGVDLSRRDVCLSHHVVPQGLLTRVLQRKGSCLQVHGQPEECTPLHLHQLDKETESASCAGQTTQKGGASGDDRYLDFWSHGVCSKHRRSHLWREKSRAAREPLWRVPPLIFLFAASTLFRGDT